jgi:ribonuclease BN (tRNA processing enzyme)
VHVTPLGVGEAFDPAEPNASVLVEAAGYMLLIDCGHSAVAPLWRTCPAPNDVDAVYLTHQHADHVLGLIPVLDRWAYDGRSKALAIITSQKGIIQLQALLTAGFIAWDDRSPFPIHFRTAQETTHIGPFAASFAPTIHDVPNVAIRLDHAGRSFAYSGDGRPTAQSAALYDGVDLLLHECFVPQRADDLPFHCDLPTVLTLTGAARIGLYHIKASQRPAMREAVTAHHRVFVPEACSRLVV